MPTVLITGANRGLGLEFARQYAADGWDVVATARESSNELDSLGVRVESLDMRDFDAVASFGDRIDNLDLLIANAGTTGPRAVTTAEDGKGWSDTFAVNSIAPYLIAQSVLPKVAEAEGKLVAISTRMGSIEDNSSGGYIAYRSSKAALNAAWRSLSIDIRDKGVAVAMFHPGWVETRMGGESAPLQPKDSIAALRDLIAGLTMEQSGNFISYDGSTIPW